MAPDNAGADCGDDFVEDLGVAVDLLRDRGFSGDGGIEPGPFSQAVMLAPDLIRKKIMEYYSEPVIRATLCVAAATEEISRHAAEDN